MMQNNEMTYFTDRRTLNDRYTVRIHVNTDEDVLYHMEDLNRAYEAVNRVNQALNYYKFRPDVTYERVMYVDGSFLNYIVSKVKDSIGKGDKELFKIGVVTKKYEDDGYD